MTKPPPDPIEEMPPEEKPEGDNVTWIPGYWAWDDERTDYLWISGTWRALPPGRTWIAGYWSPVSQGYQWTSGYWMDTTQQQATYLPAPPTTVEAGPNIPAPTPDYIWMPGCWMWARSHYAWRPGYWAVGRPDWDWIPPHYVWTRHGYIFVGGYWDYPVEVRGVLFAPVFFTPHLLVRPHFVYSPAIVIDLGVFTDHLFCRPRYHHYYFGDYYAPAYVQRGFFASFTFQIGRHGYDPIFTQHRWQHRRESDWEHRLEIAYRDRRDHENARPPHTWTQQRNIAVTTTRVENHVVVARTFDQYRKQAGSPVRYQAVAREERQKLAQRGREIQTSRDQRREVEVRAPEPRGAQPDQARPFKAQVPKSPIVAKPIREFEPKQAPPKEHRTPRPDSRVQPKPAPPAKGERGRDRGQSEPRPQPRANSVRPPAPAIPERRVDTPGVRPAPPRAQADGRIRSAPPHGRRVMPDQQGRADLPPAVLPDGSKRKARPGLGRRNEPQPPDLGKRPVHRPVNRPGQKGAEHLNQRDRGGRKDNAP